MIQIEWKKLSGDRPMREYQAVHNGKTWLLVNTQVFGLNTPANWKLTNDNGAAHNIGRGLTPTEKAKSIANGIIVGRKK